MAVILRFRFSVFLGLWFLIVNVGAATESSYWTNFAKSGDPNGPGVPHWPRFNDFRHEVMVLGERIGAAPVPDESRLHRIDHVYAAANFAFKHRYALLLIAAATLVTALVFGILRVRRWWRRTIT